MARGHQRNRNSVGSISYADLANTFNRTPGLPPVSQQYPPGHAPPPRPQEDAQRQYQLRRIAHVPTDRAIPDGVNSMVLGEVVQRYNSLRDVERKLDATLISKRFAAKDTGSRYERRLRTMRVWISCTSLEQDNGDTRMEDTFEFGDDASGGSYKLRIEGRLLPSDDGVDDDDDLDEVKLGEGTTMDLDKPEGSNGATSKPSQEKPYFERQKFSHYFQTITVSFNPPPHALPNATTPPAIQWKKPLPTQNGQHPTTADANFDALELERKLEEGVQSVTVSMERADPNGRVRGKLSPALARVLDREYEDQSGAMMGLYNYVRLNGLEQEGQPQYFRCDDALKAVRWLYATKGDIFTD
jgi:SWI/SNF-related matrix-associated actin-dependent regulator of chromatin subfamily D